MNLSEIKTKSISDLIDIATNLGIEDVGRLKKQDIIFRIFKQQASEGTDIFGGGVLEILNDGFGFLRSTENSYCTSADDIYVSPSQVRKFALRKGDEVQGKIRPPKDQERYFLNCIYKVIFYKTLFIYPLFVFLNIGYNKTYDVYHSKEIL